MGVVVDNNDPKKLGRVKCTITNLLTGSVETLPWIYPRYATNFNFVVPVVGDKLEIRFPYEDIHFGFWYGGWQDQANHITDFDTNYPETYGWKDDKNNKLILNKTLKKVDIELESGLKVSVIDSSGKAEIDYNGVKLVIDKSGKVALGDKNGTSTGGASQLDIVALMEKMNEYLSVATYAGFGAPSSHAVQHAQLQADCATLKASL